MQPSRLKAGLAAVMLLTGTAMAVAQSATVAPPGAALEFTTERRDALRQAWRTDPAIRDYIGPGDGEVLDESSDFYSEDYTARQSLAPEPPASGDVAVAARREPGR